MRPLHGMKDSFGGMKHSNRGTLGALVGNSWGGDAAVHDRQRESQEPSHGDVDRHGLAWRTTGTNPPSWPHEHKILPQIIFLKRVILYLIFSKVSFCGMISWLLYFK